MKNRIARKIFRGRISKRLRGKLDKLYPPKIVNGRTQYPSWSRYQRFAKAWVIIHRKVRKYGDNFRKL